MPITCDAPTTHFSSGCELLLHYDADNGGIINSAELNQSYADYENGIIASEEFDYVSSCYIAEELVAGVLTRTGRINLICEGCFTLTYTFDLPRSASYISMPVMPEDPNPDAVFGGEVNVWEYDTTAEGWISPTILEEGKGYYVYCPTPKTVTVSGTDCIVTIDDLIAVYNSLQNGEAALIGPGQKQIDVTDTVLEGHIEGYNRENNEWNNTNVLDPMKGYWMVKMKKKTVTFVSVPAGATVTVD